MAVSKCYKKRTTHANCVLKSPTAVTTLHELFWSSCCKEQLLLLQQSTFLMVLFLCRSLTSILRLIAMSQRHNTCHSVAFNTTLPCLTLSSLHKNPAVNKNDAAVHMRQCWKHSFCNKFGATTIFMSNMHCFTNSQSIRVRMTII